MSSWMHRAVADYRNLPEKTIVHRRGNNLRNAHRITSNARFPGVVSTEFRTGTQDPADPDLAQTRGRAARWTVKLR
jgi:hypothetical protein